MSEPLVASLPAYLALIATLLGRALTWDEHDLAVQSYGEMSASAFITRLKA